MRKAFCIVAIVWMAVIFAFSAQPGDESEDTSLAVGRAVCAIFVPHYADMSPEDQDALAAQIDHPVRKTGHATEYAILAVLLVLALPGRQYLLCELLASLYACTDEFHQLFVSGRSGQLGDVLIDACGAAVGLAIVFLVYHARDRRHRLERRSRP